MSNQSIEQKFAILQTDDSDCDFEAIAQLIAEPLDMTVADLVLVLPQRSGILAENLFEYVAKQCLFFLTHAGVQAVAIPQHAVIEPPNVVSLSSGGPGDNVFFYVAPDQRGVVQWRDVVWIDFITLQEPTTKIVEDWEIAGTGRGRVRRTKSLQPTFKKSLYVDLVSYEPWMLLRIPLEQFDFTATGLRIFPNRWQNLVALAATIVSRATEARLGAGLRSIRSGSLPQEPRAQIPSVYHGCLRWQLTKLFFARPSE